MRVPQAESRRRRSFRFRGWIVGVVVSLVVAVFVFRELAFVWTDYLWFDSVGYGNTWRDLALARLAPAAVFTAVFFVIMLANLVVADRFAPKYRAMGPEDELVERYRQFVGPWVGRIRMGVALFFALIAGVGVSSQWQEWILFTNRVDFGVKDPQFGMDAGFYVFTLPFLQFIVEWLFAGLVIILIVTGVAYYLNGGIRVQSPHRRVTPQVKAHLSLILAIMALVKTAEYWLARYGLNSSSRGVVQGASATDVDAQLPAFNLLVIISVIAALLFLINIRRRGWVLPIIAVGLWAFVSLVVGTIYPAIYQAVSVDPNELQKEERYIARNIEATRDAYELADVDVKDYRYAADLTPESIAENRVTIDNARLWDPDWIRPNFQQGQTFGTFYRFGEVDVDRYVIDGQQRQVLVGARQLNLEDLPSQSWVNRHLVYTHGYGLVVAPGNRATDDGEPTYVLKDIPPTGEIDVERPELYYGEGIGGYSIVDSKSEEFNYSRENQEAVFNEYSGDGGVALSSVFRRAAFFARFNDFNILISGEITGSSKVVYNRDVRAAASKAAPFLRYDSDPYPAIVDGRVYWVLDAYTTTSKYPYSQGFSADGGENAGELSSDFNYVRNSVKVVLDAFDGSLHFYVIDPDDPLIRAYRKAFPDVFSDFDELPDGLEDHLRYPEDLFRVQTKMFGQYHVTNARSFYNRTDRWVVSPDPGSGELERGASGDSGNTTTTLRPQSADSDTPRVTPYYLLMRLPGQEQESFLILRPFVPVSRNNALNNLASFMVAKSDPDDYGKLEVYVMPSGRTVTGPPQVDAAINGTQEISEQFTLLGQSGTGSTVIQGSMQLVPVGNSILYVRPIYVQSNTSPRIPLFNFVIVFYDGEAVFAPTVDEALAKLGLAEGPVTPPEPGPVPEPGPAPEPADTTLEQLLDEAAKAFDAASEALRNEDFAEYDDQITKARDLVDQALALLGQETAGSTTTTSTTSTTAAPPASVSTTTAQEVGTGG